MAKVAKVQSRKVKRTGRGFSTEEIKKAGITAALARKLKVPVDTRRKSSYDFNIEELKSLALPEKKPKAKKAVKAAPKKKEAPKKKAPAQKPAAKAKPKKTTKKPAKKTSPKKK